MNSEVVHGQVLAGKYRVEELLGRGGMGVVMAALHLQLSQKVALKFLTKEACQLPEAVARFLREARAAVQIQSEHVARVLDVGTLETGAPYIVMEYLRGMDLKDLGRQRGPLPAEEAVDYLIQALDAVAEAHALGIVHRDLKPSNLFVTHRPDGSPLVKVLDFGISKAIQADASSQMQITATAAIMGSPQYMSPEQIRSSKNVDARSDIWALGTILHELLAGTPAYTADTVPGLLATIVADPPQSLSSARPDLPPGLEAVVLRCLEKDREKRYASVGELSRALLPFAPADSRPLVTRICRVLGEREQAPPLSEPPRSKTVVQPRPEPKPVPAVAASQTNGSFARTGTERAAWYQKGGVQVGMGLSAIALGVIGWLTLSAPPSEPAQPATGSAPQTMHALPAPATPGAATASARAAAQAPAPLPPPPVEPAPAIRLAPASSNEAPSAVAPNTVAPRAAVSTAAPSASASSARDPAPRSKPVERAAPRQRAKAPQRSAAKAAATARPPEPAAIKPPEPTPRPAATTKPKKNESYDDLFGDTK